MSVEQATLFEYEEPGRPWVTVGEAIAGLPDDAPNHERANHSPTMIKRISQTPQGEGVYSGQAKKRLETDGVAYVPTGRDPTSGFVHPIDDRTLTNREYARLQSFPDFFVFCGSTGCSVYLQIRNAVPPLLAERLAEQYAVRKEWVTVGEALSDIPDDAPNHDVRWPSESVQERWGKRTYGVDVYDPEFAHQFKLDPGKPSNTVTSSNRHFHPFEPRNITIRECARLHSFPDEFVFTGTLTEQQRQVGNAVPPLLAFRLAVESVS